MEEKIGKMFRRDCALIIGFMVFLWVVLAYVLKIVSGLTDDPAVKTVAMGAGIIAGIAATSGMVAVISHLKNNKKELYTQDITCGMGE